MELWIRSQDKTTLIRSYEIYISEQPNTYLIRAKRTSHILGSYSTIERAIEVLDEIQDELISSDFMPTEKNEEVVLTCGSARIYEMPEN